MDAALSVLPGAAPLSFDAVQHLDSSAAGSRTSRPGTGCGSG